jgi:hypothetical protein
MAGRGDGFDQGVRERGVAAGAARATLPGCVEKLMRVPTPDSVAAKPLPISTERVPMARARLRVSGLSRQASE